VPFESVAVSSIASGAGGSGGAAVGTAALLSNPITVIAGAALSIGLLIKNIFAAHHAKAVATEAGALNAAVPAAEQSFQAIFSALNSGSIDAPGASAALDTTLQQYEVTVYDQFGVKRKEGNGPTVLEGYLKGFVTQLKNLISSGGGSTTLHSLDPAKQGFKGTPALTISYSPVSSNVLGTVKANPGKSALIVLAVLLVLWVVFK
jgi:hypothetical protein